MANEIVNIDYSFKNGETVWFTYKLLPEDDSDWLKAVILDLNWAYCSAAIQIEGYKSVSVHGISSLHRKKFYCK